VPFVLIRTAANLAEEAFEANGDDYNKYIPYRVCLFRAGRTAEARSVGTRMNEVLRKQLETVPEDVRARILLSSNLAEGGESEESIRHLQTAMVLRPNDGTTLYNAACTYGCLKIKKEALDMLKRAFASGYGNRDWAARDSDLDYLHDNPEFRELVGLRDATS